MMLDAEKVEKLLVCIRPGMPPGIALDATCRGDWLDFHLSYDGARLSRIKAFWLRQFVNAKVELDPRRETLKVLGLLEVAAKRAAERLVRLRGVEFRFEEIWAGRPCVHFGAGGYICDFCRLWVPRLS